ncbi:hypothetical protein [Coprobacillus cateniformis]|uniref:hypothetical protein n=1 Tax=Coprobacillus cateniformis TaxID=100884 RepID=UPI000E4A67CB|nr:hypothetical protein [Coprobacillus cateniformis]RGY49314.1 hypothetical protein DXA41_02210 [Coprobacillus cateniformis]
MKRKLKLIFISILIVPILSGCTKEKMELKNNSFTVEYGNAISDKAEDYLKNSEEFLKNLKVENLPKNEKDKEYPSIGEYEIVLKTDNQKEVVKVSVKDTVAPEFKDLKEKYEVEYGTKIDSKQFSATDLSKTEITLDDSKVNYKKSGTYKATVIAKDSSNNETKKDINIIVKAEEKKESNTNTSSNQKFSNNSSSVSSGSNSSKKSNGSSSSSTNSNSISTDANDYLCLENNCGKHFKTYSELQKHQKEQGHGGYAVGHESFEWPDNWN